MTNVQVSKRYQAVHLPRWTYLGGEVLTMDGSSQTLGIPTEAEIVEIDAEGGALYYNIRGPAASSTSTNGYVPSEGGRIIGPLTDLATTGITIWGTAATGAVAHIQYFKRA